MKIWILDPAQLTPYYNIALCDALAETGCQVRYITSRFLYDSDLPFSGRFQTNYHYFKALENPTLVKFPRLRRILRGLGYPLGHWQLLRQIKANPPDVLHIQWSRLPFFDRWLIRAIKKLGIPIVHTVHEVMPTFESARFAKSLEPIYAQADALILHTETNRRDFQTLFPNIQPSKAHLIPHIAIPYTALPVGASKAQARAHLGLPADVPVISFFGAVKHYKGLDILVKAFQIAVQSCPDLYLLAAGHPETAEDRDQMEQASHLPQVHVQANYIPYEDMWLYHLAADVVVLPYRSITQSGALLSSMGFGRPVIVTAVGGLPESVNGNGWVVPPEDAEALAAAIVESVSNPDRLHQMGERSAALVRERYDGAAIARQTIALYEQVLQPAGDRKS